MRSIFTSILSFIKANPSIIYSLALVFIIPSAFFINTYFTTSDFEKNVDKIIQRHADMTENIIQLIARGTLNETNKLQELITEVAQENKDIVELEIYKPNLNGESFKVVASANSDTLGKEVQDIQKTLAWSQPEGIAFLSQNNQERFWRVTKSFKDAEGNKAALISISFSLKVTDQLIRSTINRAYLTLIITLLVVILFISNQVRLFGYALTLSKLKEIDKMKDTFISMASHELRAPLTAIKGYLEFLGDKIKMHKDDEETKNYVAKMNISVERINNMVSDILEVSRIEGNRIPMEIVTIDPEKTILESVEELRSSAMLKGLNLTLKNDAGAINIKADANRLKQIIVNLVSNAIKYTEKGSVDVILKTSGDKYLVTVADTGIGISAENQKKLFEKFYRVQSEKTQKIIGTGLGLWITLELAKKMNSRITVESMEGVGSRFTLYLPIDIS